MIYKLTIPGLLPGLNEYINAERSNRHSAAQMKKQIEHMICCFIKNQLRGLQIEEPVIIRHVWIEKNRMRDKDNICFAKKFIWDALVKSGVIQNDGWNEIHDFCDEFIVDNKQPRVEVYIETID